ncbi:unnamed protein product, partial [Polarella glacialis]
MTKKAMEKVGYSIDVRIRSLELTKGEKEPRPIQVRLAINHVDNGGKAVPVWKADAPQVMTRAPKPEMGEPKRHTDGAGTAKKHKNMFASWDSTESQFGGWDWTTFNFSESEVGFLSYEMDILCLDSSADARFKGVWKESLGHLWDRIQEKGRQLHFKASLDIGDGVHGGAETGRLELEIDIYEQGNGKHEAAFGQSGTSKIGGDGKPKKASSVVFDIPVRGGMMPPDMGASKEHYHVSAFCMGMP